MDLAARIEWALANRGAMQAYATRAYQRVLRQNDWSEVGAQYQKLIDHIAEASTNPGPVR